MHMERFYRNLWCMERLIEPDKAVLYDHAGDIYRALKRYEDAFSSWRKALEPDNTYLNAVYSMGFCYEELEQYGDACKVWTELAQELDRRGLVIEREYPANRAEDCRKRMA